MSPVVQRIPLHPFSPAAELLVDPLIRLILERVNDARGGDATTADVAEHAASRGFNARLTRDRLRRLEREALASASTHGAGQRAATTRWSLTPAGRDLHGTLAIATRVLENAAARSSARRMPRAELLGVAFGLLADRDAGRVLSALGEHPGPVSPTTLEAACTPVSRRTMYRRLEDLGSAEVALHVTHSTVPRTSSWELSPRWRSAASVPMLLAWWDWRRDGPPTSAAKQVRALAMTVLPVLHGRGLPSGVVEWQIGTPTEEISLRVAFADGGARVDDSTPPSAVASADALTWLGALVAGRREEIEVQGDSALAASALDSIRAALLTDVR